MRAGSVHEKNVLFVLDRMNRTFSMLLDIFPIYLCNECSESDLEMNMLNKHVNSGRQLRKPVKTKKRLW